MKTVFAWSGGKDSALALYELRKSKEHDVLALLTTITEDYDRVSMHGVRRSLIEKQAESLGIALEKIFITKRSSNGEYEAKMEERLVRYQKLGATSAAFGDIFLEDLKKYREENLSRIGMEGIFPIWKRPSIELAGYFIDSGFEAVVTCIDSKVLDRSFAGRTFDREFLSDLPAGVDPCGENGEFHSFVHNGPIFRNRIPFEKGEVVLRDNRYYFCDLTDR